MIIDMYFEDEIFYIIPPKPCSDNFKILKEHEDNVVTVTHVNNTIYHSREQAELNLCRLQV